MNTHSSVNSLLMITWLDHLCLPGRLLNLMLGNHPQIVGNHTPPDPPLHPIIAVIPTALQPMPPFEPTDASFDPRTPVPSASEPPLPLVRLSRRRFAPWSRQHHSLHAPLHRCLFILRCRQFAI